MSFILIKHISLQDMWKSTVIAVRAMPEESVELKQSWGENIKHLLQKKFGVMNELPVYFLDAQALKEDDLKQKTSFER